MTVRTPLAAVLLLSGALLGAPPAGAVDDTKPAVACYGLNFSDKKGDVASTAPAPQDADRSNLDVTGGFYKYDPSKGAEATTFNIQIANLSTAIPSGDTALSWYVAYGEGDGDPWVRALTDFTGIVSYEYGHYSIVGPQTQSVRDGSTTGGFFEGPDGIIQLVYPADGPGKPGTQLKAATVTANEAVQALPGAAPTPAKGGLLWAADTANGKGGYTVGSACPATQPGAPAPVSGGTPTTGLDTGAGPLPVKVTSKSFKAKKVKKTLALKLTASEPLTQVGAQLKKGKKVLGKGSLAKLSGKGTLKLKLSKKLKKGTYALDLVGTDAKGARRFNGATIKVR